MSALNTRTNLIAGQQTREDGRYDFSIAAAPGDEIMFWYSRSNMNSPGIVIIVPEPAPANSGGAGGALPVE